jgi:hypothetical protein
MNKESPAGRPGFLFGFCAPLVMISLFRSPKRKQTDWIVSK